MKQYKWERRAKKQFKKKNGMRVSGRSLFLIENIKKEKAEEIKKGRQNKKFLTEQTEI